MLWKRKTYVSGSLLFSDGSKQNIHFFQRLKASDEEFSQVQSFETRQTHRLRTYQTLGFGYAESKDGTQDVEARKQEEDLPIGQLRHKVWCNLGQYEVESPFLIVDYRLLLLFLLEEMSQGRVPME